MMRRDRALAVVLMAAVAASQDLGDVDYVEECPVQNGFFADAVQCDRYYECKNGEVRTHFNLGGGFNRHLVDVPPRRPKFKHLSTTCHC